MRLKLKNNGDTIVEVLIAVAVLMVVITGGYSIATRSLNGARIAQERSEATMLAQGQLEAIYQRVNQAKSLLILVNGYLPGGNLDVRGSFVGVEDSFDEVQFTDPPLSLDSSKIWDNGFCVTSGGADPGHSKDSNSASDCTVGLYKIKITTKIEDIGGPKKYLIYNVNVSWDKSGGGTTKEEINLVGRFVVEV